MPTDVDVDIYARVSRASDKRDLSTPGQVTVGKEIAEDRGLTVREVHMDPSKSAWNPKVYRPGWEALMRRLESGEVRNVIIFELTRFARRSEDGLRILRIAERVRVIDTENDYDLTKARDRKTFRDAISANEFESDMISLRTRRGKKLKAKERMENNSSTRAFGFELGNVAPREAEAKVLREIAERVLAGEEQWPLCRELNDRGVTTVLGNPWKPPSLRVALLRPANVGDVVHRGTVIHRGAHPGILDRDTYDRLVAFYGSRRRGRPAENLATGFARCACGHALNAKELIRHNPYPDGRPRKAYLCVKRDGGCGNRIDWLDLDEFLRDLALAILSDPVHADAIEREASAASAELGRVQVQIAELEQLAVDLSAKLGAGQLKQNRYDAAIKPLDEQLEKLQAREAELVALAPERELAFVRQSRVAWENRWNKGSVADRRDIVKQALRGQRLVVAVGPRLQPASERCSTLV